MFSAKTSANKQKNTHGTAYKDEYEAVRKTHKQDSG